MKRWLAPVALAILLAVPGWAGPLEEADALARQGAYSGAEEAYRRISDPNLQQIILGRRLALAQIRLDAATFATLSQELETTLKHHPQPELALRLELGRGLLAFRTGQARSARQAFARAEALARGMTGPLAALARFECRSYAFHASLLENTTVPSLADYKKEAPFHLEGVQGLWPLDISRTLAWRREWVRKACEFSLQMYYSQRFAAQLEWKALAVEIGETATRELFQAYSLDHDPEKAFASIHVLLELCDGLSADPLAEVWLPQCKAALQAGAALANSDEQTYLWGRYERALARHRFFYGGQPAEALSGYLAAVQRFEAAHRPLEAIDAELEMAFDYLFYAAPETWGPAVEQQLETALRASSEVYPLGECLAHSAAAYLKVRRGDLKGSESHFRQALVLVEAYLTESAASPQAKQALLAKCRPVSDAYMEVLVKLGRPQEALELSQKLQAQADLAALDLAHLKARKPEVQKALRQIEDIRQNDQRLRAQLQATGGKQPGEAVRAQLASNKQEFYKALNVVRASDPEYERLVSIRPSVYSKIQPHLPSDVAIVQYYPGPERLYIFTVTTRELRINTVPVGRAAVEKQVAAVRQSLSRDDRLTPACAQNLQELRQLLIDPIEGYLGEARTILLVPGGTLSYLPFGALAKKRGEGLQYLVESKALAVLTSPDLIDLAAGRGEKPSSLLALADPDGSLPGAKEEVKRFSPLFPQCQVFYGRDATKARLDKLQGTSIVHFATHGVVSHDVNQNYLVMGGAGADGRLTAGEIYGLNLTGVSLVTLSACKTALGEMESQAEYASLAQAFGLAGCKSMLASLWSVDDEATARLMIGFYQNLLAGQSKAEALRQAQISLLGDPKLNNPRLWSAFELMGDWR